MKLSDWARQNGIDYRTAHRLVQARTFPGKVRQLATGTILVTPDDESGVYTAGATRGTGGRLRNAAKAEAIRDAESEKVSA